MTSGGPKTRSRMASQQTTLSSSTSWSRSLSLEATTTRSPRALARITATAMQSSASTPSP
jgi:hypothetical protein